MFNEDKASRVIGIVLVSRSVGERPLASFRQYPGLACDNEKHLHGLGMTKQSF